MKTCRDCVHYTPCWRATSVALKQHLEKNEIVQYCADFLDRRRIYPVILGVGEEAYIIKEGKIETITVVEVNINVRSNEMVHYDFVAENEGGIYYFNDADLNRTVDVDRGRVEAILARWNGVDGRNE